MSRNDEIKAVAAQLDLILDALRDNVAELNGILTRPAGGDETDERLVAP